MNNEKIDTLRNYDGETYSNDSSTHTRTTKDATDVGWQSWGTETGERGGETAGKGEGKNTEKKRKWEKVGGKGGKLERRKRESRQKGEE